MDNLYARAVFFTRDAEAALQFYTANLGFTADWTVVEEGRTTVFQVSLFGFEVILNQTGSVTDVRAGHGRVFIGLEDEQGDPVRKHLVATGVQTDRYEWGRPTLVVKDLDQNELFFWFPNDDFSGFAPSV